MHARMLRSTRAAARAVQAAARTPAPSPAHLVARQPALAQSHLRLLSSTAIARSDSNAAASNVSESVAAQSSSAAAAAAPTPEPEQSPAPIDQQHATELPTEEIPAVSSSLDATAQSNSQAATTSEPEQSPAPIDQQHATELPTEEIPAVSSSLDATAPKPAEEAKPEQPTPEQIAEKVSRTVFVAGLNWSVTDEVLIEEVHKHLEAEEGVSQVRIATDPAGRSKGFAFVELASTDLVQQLLSNPTLVIADREAIFRASKTPIGHSAARDPPSKKYPTKRGPNARYPPGQTIYVGNVAWSADEIALEEVFGKYGNIKRINQPKDAETGRSTGVAFIEFEDLEAAQKAFRAANGRGIRVDGRPVRVDFAKNGSHQDGAQRTTSAAGGRVE